MVTTQPVTPTFIIHAGIIHQIQKTQHKKNAQLIKRHNYILTMPL